MKIVFTTSNGWLSKTIRFFTRAKVSHVAFTYYDSLFEREMVIEAITAGFHVRTVDKLLKESIIVDSFEIKDEAAALKVLGDWLCTPYDFGGLIGEAIVQIAKIFKRRIKNPLSSGKALFCSEAGAHLLQKLGVPGSEVLDPSTTDPQTLLDFLNSNATNP